MIPATTAYIGLGSNLNEPLSQLKSAVSALESANNIQLIAVSKFYKTTPMGPQDQPDYINAVAEIATTLNANDLLKKLQAIENQHGRIRNTGHWGARTLDLDLLTFGSEKINEVHLTVPHVGIRERSFVLYPLRDLTNQLDVANFDSIDCMIEALGEPCPDIIS